MPTIPVYEQRTTPEGALVFNPRSESPAEGLAVLSRGLKQVATSLQAVNEADDMARASRILAERRKKLSEKELADATKPAVPPEIDAIQDPAARIEALKKQATQEVNDAVQDIGDSMSAVQLMKTNRGKAYLEQGLLEMNNGFEERAKLRQAQVNGARRLDEHDKGVSAAERALEADPSQFESVMREQDHALDVIGMDQLTRMRQKNATLDRLSEAAARGKATQDPIHVLEQLKLEKPDDPVIAALPTPQSRARVQAMAEDSYDNQESARIMKLYRDDVRAGDRAVRELENSSLPPERLDGVRRKVRSSLDLMREERQAQAVDRIAGLETAISRGDSPVQVQREAADLYRRGALTPAQYASAMERSTSSAVRSAEAFAIQREIANAISQGIPLDPQNEQHRKFLASAFASDTQQLTAGSPEWQAVALAYAGRARMLPAPAASWLRSAARSPDPKVAEAGAQFYGSLDQVSPEAVGNVDSDTRAFLGSYSDMLAAGARSEVAFQTARSNVFEARRDVVEERRKVYGSKYSEGNAAALSDYIDRDFDTVLSKQPEASATLSADFDKQTAQYFQKVGDIGLARELAWKDVSRIYGTTRVNGDPVVSAFPVERFGVSPAEVRKDLEAWLKQHPHEGVSADSLLVVPDGLTLRAVNDAQSGRPVMPSYRVVTKDGDLLLGPDGVPVRYTLPSSDDLSDRVRKAQEKARADALLNVEQARKRRAAMEFHDWTEATSRIPSPTEK